MFTYGKLGGNPVTQELEKIYLKYIFIKYKIYIKYIFKRKEVITARDLCMLHMILNNQYIYNIYAFEQLR